MSVVPPTLPTAIAQVEIPVHFHPSALVELERCALSVLGTPGDEGNGDLLIPHPTAFLGVALHHVRQEVLEGRWGDAGDPVEAVRNVLAEVVDDVESFLTSSRHTSSLVPLRRAVGRRAWVNRTRDLESWALGAELRGTSESPRRLVIESARPTLTKPHRRAGDAMGVEQTFQDDDLRLRGRPDWVERVSTNRVVVVDYKSGRLFDADGNILERHLVQVQAYALIVERTFPGVVVEPYLEGARRIRVPWGATERRRITDRLAELSVELPAHADMGARSIARAGVHCRLCRLRPVCSTYLEQAPRWWPDDRENPRPLPLDVWGVVTKVSRRTESVDLEMVDAADRRVRVDGFAPAHTESFQPDDHVWFFDLEASEDLNQHGLVVQPRNFHQRPPGPRWREARRARVFVAEGT